LRGLLNLIFAPPAFVEKESRSSEVRIGVGNECERM
jgi:hypothetical protein